MLVVHGILKKSQPESCNQECSIIRLSHPPRHRINSSDCGPLFASPPPWISKNRSVQLGERCWPSLLFEPISNPLACPTSLIETRRPQSAASTLLVGAVPQPTAVDLPFPSSVR